MSTDSKKEKALDLAINQIDRQFGKGAIMKMGGNHISISDNVISTCRLGSHYIPAYFLRASN